MKIFKIIPLKYKKHIIKCFHVIIVDNFRLLLNEKSGQGSYL